MITDAKVMYSNVVHLEEKFVIVFKYYQMFFFKICIFPLDLQL